LSERLDAIALRPLSFAKLETLPGDQPYRRALLTTFRYAVIFEIIEDGIVVLAVVHASREPNYWLGR
jgi:plasmid stabilization system protein ParE